MYLRASSAAKLIDLPMSTFYQLVREGGELWAGEVGVNHRRDLR